MRGIVVFKSGFCVVKINMIYLLFLEIYEYVLCKWIGLI